jgi:hypothetical protein
VFTRTVSSNTLNRGELYKQVLKLLVFQCTIYIRRDEQIKLLRYLNQCSIGFFVEVRERAPDSVGTSSTICVVVSSTLLI